MRKRRFLAIAAAFAVSMTFAAAPVTVLATQPGEEYEDTIDDEQEEGEQMTVAEPGAEDGGDAGSGTSDGSTGGSSGNSGNSTSSGGSQSTAKSSDSSLSYLGISPGSLSPSFSSGTFEYTATVDADVTSVSIPARTNSSKAVIASVTGAKSITPGTNTVKVVVEAENGSTSTYTITVQCGSAGTGNTPAQQPEDIPGTIEGEITTGEPEGEITGDDEEEEPEETSEVTFDSNGYLIYEGNAYIPSEMMPEGEYVSLDKYNTLYEQAQAEKTKTNRMVIIFAVVLVVFISLIVGLAFKLRDVRQDARLGILGLDDDDLDDFSEKKKAPKARTKATAADTTMIPDVKLPEQMKTKAPERAKADAKAPERLKTPEKSKAPEKPKAPAKAPEKKKAAKADEDFEILDLNDL